MHPIPVVYASPNKVLVRTAADHRRADSFLAERNNPPRNECVSSARGCRIFAYWAKTLQLTFDFCILHQNPSNRHNHHVWTEDLAARWNQARWGSLRLWAIDPPSPLYSIANVDVDSWPVINSDPNHLQGFDWCRIRCDRWAVNAAYFRRWVSLFEYSIPRTIYLLCR